MLLTDRYQINSPRIIHDTIDGETIIIDFDSGTYYSLTGAGGAIWSLVAAGADCAEIALELAKRYEADNELLARDAEAFIQKLLDHEMLAARDEAPTSSPSQGLTNGRMKYVPPDLAVYTDMQELLLLDPIHEVDEQGWPRPKNG